MVKNLIQKKFKRFLKKKTNKKRYARKMSVGFHLALRAFLILLRAAFLISLPLILLYSVTLAYDYNKYNTIDQCRIWAQRKCEGKSTWYRQITINQEKENGRECKYECRESQLVDASWEKEE